MRWSVQRHQSGCVSCAQEVAGAAGRERDEVTVGAGQVEAVEDSTRNASFSATPSTTTMRAPGTCEKALRDLTHGVSHKISSASETAEMITASPLADTTADDDVGEGGGRAVRGAEEVEVALVGGVASEGVRDLLEDDHDADRREHPLDDGVRARSWPRARVRSRPKCDLDHAAQHDGQQEGRETSPSVSIAVATITARPAAGPLTLTSEPESSETIRPPTIPAMMPGEERRAGGQRDAQAQRQRHEENDEARGGVGRERGERVREAAGERTVWSTRVRGGGLVHGWATAGTKKENGVRPQGGAPGQP